MDKKNVRCAFISSYMGPYYGNYVASVIACEKKMQGKGWYSVYVFPKDVEHYEWVEKLREVTDRLYFLEYRPFSISNILALRKIFKKEKINLIHSRMCGWDFTARFAAPFTPIVWHMEMGVNLSVRIKYIKNWIKFKILALGKVYHTAASVAATEAINSLKPAHRCVAIPNALDLSRLRPLSKPYDSEKAVKNLLVFAYNPNVKGLDVALDACEKLNREKTRFQLLVSAQKNTYTYLEERYPELPDWIQILLPTDDIASVYEQCDIMMIPSRSEGFSYALTEALYTGLPAVCSEIPGNRWAKELKGTYYFESENPDALCEAIENCAKQGIREEEQLFNRSVIEERYSMETWAEDVIRFMEGIRL